MKENEKNLKWKRIVSSAVVLAPILAGVILWESLPQQMAIHWGVDGNADGFAGKGVVVFGMPLLLLALHWICIFATARDPKNKNQSRKVFGMVLWIVPMLSVFVNGFSYAHALGKETDVLMMILLLLGALFVILGNYMPKCKQNHTIGIRIPWTLHQEANWTATHRFAGKLWVTGGLLCMIGAFLPKTVSVWIVTALLLILVIAPIVYSYAFQKKHGE